MSNAEGLEATAQGALAAGDHAKAVRLFWLAGDRESREQVRILCLKNPDLQNEVVKAQRLEHALHLERKDPHTAVQLFHLAGEEQKAEDMAQLDVSLRPHLERAIAGAKRDATLREAQAHAARGAHDKADPLFHAAGYPEHTSGAIAAELERQAREANAAGALLREGVDLLREARDLLRELLGKGKA